MINAIYTNGDFIGYTAILENKPYAENAEFMEDSELMLIPAEDFTALINKDMIVAQQFIKLLTKIFLTKKKSLLH